MTLFLICFFTHSSHIIAYCEHICIYSISAAIYWLFNIVQVGKVPQVQRRPASGSTVVSLSRRSEWKSERNGAKKKKRESGRWGLVGVKKMAKTEASAEVRDEKGKILFSFHVIKYLLSPYKSPTEHHSSSKRTSQGTRERRGERRGEREREKRRESTGLGATLRHHPIGLSHLY